MRSATSILLCFLLLCGCSSGIGQLDAAMFTREQLLNGNGCSFIAEVTADYGDELYSFSMNCIFDIDGNMKFTVIEPETLSDVSGNVNTEGGALTFDDRVLGFPMLADDLITPVTAPWVMIKALRSGYISSCGRDGDGYRIQIDDSYEENALTLDLWIDDEYRVEHCDYLWNGYRTLTVEIQNYTVL